MAWKSVVFGLAKRPSFLFVRVVFGLGTPGLKNPTWPKQTLRELLEGQGLPKTVPTPSLNRIGSAEGFVVMVPHRGQGKPLTIPALLWAGPGGERPTKNHSLDHSAVPSLLELRRWAP